MKKRNWKIGALAVAVVVAVAGAGAIAWAGPGGWHRGARMQGFITHRVDAALDQARATDSQRQAIHTAIDNVFATIKENRGDRHQEKERMLQLFESDHLDASQIDALRAEQQAHRKAVGDAISRAIVTAHDVLSPDQRRVVADWMREHHGHPGVHGRQFQRQAPPQPLEQQAQ